MGKPKKGSSLLLLLLGLLLLVADNSAASASAVSPALEIVSEVVSNAASSLLRRLWSGKSTAKMAAQGSRPLMKFEGGYTVDTVFDGSKLGIEPYSVVVAQSGELLVLDSVNSNLYGISLPLSRYSRPKLVAGSAEGYAGHVDGKLREARMNHPRGFTMDDRGNIYVADTLNMAIRKISDTGVTTIAGGKWKKGGHLDGPSEDAKFSNDFEVVYVASSCSLLIVDRGNQAIREIQLNFDDCAYQYEAGFPLGMMVLFAAGFFGYMLALLQRRVGILVSSSNESQAPIRPSMPPYYKPMKHYVRPPYVRPPLIPTGDETEKTEKRFFSSIGKLISGAFSSMTDIFGATFPIFITKSRAQYQHQQYRMNALPMQESFAIPDDEIPPPVETRVSTPRKTYAFMSKEPEKIHHIRHGRPHFSGWDAALPPQQPQMHQQQHLQQHRQYSSGPRTYYEQSCETTNEIVFGAVQEMDNKRRTVQIKAVNYGDPMYEHYGLRYRNSFMGYTSNY